MYGCEAQNDVPDRLPACADAPRRSRRGVGIRRPLTLPASLTAIQAEAFIGDSDLEEVVLPGGLEIIGASAFKDCTGLKRINLPWVIGSIGANAFAGCPDLTATVVEGSYAHTWCQSNGVNYTLAGAQAGE